MKEKIDALLCNINRGGIDLLRRFLDESDFYTAPCSTKFHLAKPGGLAEHTVNVIECAVNLNFNYNQPVSAENCIIAALGHDLCKVGIYKEIDEPPTDPQIRYLTSLMSKHGLAVPAKMNKAYCSSLIDFMLKTYKKEEKLPDYIHNYTVDDTFPLGHGEKSLWVLSQFIHVYPEEALAIRWHMAAFDAGIHFPIQVGMLLKKL